MMTYLLIGVLGGLLLASAGWNVALLVARHDLMRSTRLSLHECNDRAHAAEVRSAEQIDAMLDRISTSPRLEVSEPAPPLADPEERSYISDFQYDDETWNDFRSPNGDGDES